MPKYQVTVTRTEFALIDIEADSEEEAKKEAYTEATENYEDQCWETTSIDAAAKEQDDEDEDEYEEDQSEKPAPPFFGLDKEIVCSFHKSLD